MATKKDQGSRKGGEPEQSKKKGTRQVEEEEESGASSRRGSRPKVASADASQGAKRPTAGRMPGSSSSAHEEDAFEESEDDEESLEEEDVETSWEELAEDPELMSRLLESLGGVVPGIFKRVAVSGVGNLLLSEDGLRTLLSENKKLPKEAVGLLVSQADVMRREVLRIISKEIRIFLENMDFGGEIAKILTSVSFEIKTEIRFIPNDQAVKPKIKNKIKAKRQRGEEEQGDEESEAPLEEATRGKESESTTPAAEEPRAGGREDGMQRGAANLVRKLARGMRQRREEHEVSEAEQDEDDW